MAALRILWLSMACAEALVGPPNLRGSSPLVQMPGRPAKPAMMSPAQGSPLVKMSGRAAKPSMMSPAKAVQILGAKAAAKFGIGAGAAVGAGAAAANLGKVVLPEVDAAVQVAMVSRLHFVAACTPLLIAVLGTRSASGLPDIARLLKSKDARGLSARVFYGDALVYMSRAVYHIRMGYPISCWSELLVLLAQNLGLFALVRKYRMANERRFWVKSGLDAAFLLAAAVACMLVLPARLVPWLCLWTVPLALGSYGVQINAARRGGATRSFSAPQLTQLTLRWLGCLARIGTTAWMLGGDGVVMATHAIGFGGCSVLMVQQACSNAAGLEALGSLSTRASTRKSLYGQLFARGRPALTMWRSLGGFGELGNDASEPVSEAELRRGFDEIDANGDGSISADELKRAVRQQEGAGWSDVDCAATERMVASMVVAADADGDGQIDFEEYRGIILGTSAASEGSKGKGE